MYLHTRLLLGIAVITLFALGVTVVVPLWSVRTDVTREMEASLQLASLFLDLQRDIRTSDSSAEARTVAAQAVRSAAPLRHVKIVLLDPSGAQIAASPTDEGHAWRLARAFLPPGAERVLSYPISYRGTSLGTLRVSSNPLSEISELEERVDRDLALLGLTLLAMAASIYSMVRRGLRPVGQIQAALAALEAGALGTRLPHFRLKDLAEIARRFNHCAAALEEAAAQRRELTRRLIEVEEEERRRLAAELHDELGQSLTAIKVDAAYIAREAAGAPQIEACAAGIERLTSEIMELIRGMLARLRPHGLETVGLRETLEELVNGWQARVGDRLGCTLAIDGPVDSLSAGLSITVYRLIQECLTNAVRHSRARAISMHLTVVASEVEGGSGRVTIQVRELDVAPDGPPASAKGMGLLGMRERVEAQGGQLRIAALEPGGMSLEAWMPIRPALEESGGA